MAHYMFQTSTAIGIIIAIILLLLTSKGQEIFISILTFIIYGVLLIITAPFVGLFKFILYIFGADMDRINKIYEDKQNKKY